MTNGPTVIASSGKADAIALEATRLIEELVGLSPDLTETAIRELGDQSSGQSTNPSMVVSRGIGPSPLFTHVREALQVYGKLGPPSKLNKAGLSRREHEQPRNLAPNSVLHALFVKLGLAEKVMTPKTLERDLDWYRRKMRAEDGRELARKSRR